MEPSAIFAVQMPRRRGRVTGLVQPSVAFSLSRVAFPHVSSARQADMPAGQSRRAVATIGGIPGYGRPRESHTRHSAPSLLPQYRVFVLGLPAGCNFNSFKHPVGTTPPATIARAKTLLTQARGRPLSDACGGVGNGSNYWARRCCSRQPISRPRPLASCHVGRVREAAPVDRQAAAADALSKPGSQTLQFGDALVDAPCPLSRQP